MASKVFEVGDVLPATTQLRISWNEDVVYYAERYQEWVKTDNNNFELIGVIDDDDPYYVLAFGWGDPETIEIYNNGFYSPYTNYGGDHAYIDIDTSSWTEAKRTVSSIGSNITTLFSWEDLNAPSVYTITFETNGGSLVSDISDATELPTPLPTTTKANHVFAGWYYDNLFTQKANAGDVLTANVTLYAKWYTPTTWCEDIADAIREKEGSSGDIKHVDFADRIRDLDTCIYLTQEEYDLLDTPNENITYIIVEVE